MKLLVTTLGCCLIVQPATAQQKSTADAIAEQRVGISRSADGAYSGPGWERLLADARAAQFVMIGEQHATADIAGFGLALHRALAPLGYNHAALEVGPHSTDHVEELIRSGSGKLAGFMATRAGPGCSTCWSSATAASRSIRKPTRSARVSPFSEATACSANLATTPR